MLKKISACTAALILMCTPCFAGDIGVNIDGKRIVFQGQQPVIIDGRTLIPLRGVFDSLGYEISWAGDTKTATLTKDNTCLSIVIGQSKYYLNGVTHETDVPAQIINGSTMLPLRAVAEAAGLGVVWNADSKTAVLMSGSSTDAADTPALVYTDNASDTDFLNKFKAISNAFDNAVNTFNDVLGLVKTDGIHSQEDCENLSAAAAEMKKAADTALALISPLDCTEKTAQLKAAYSRYIKAASENANVVYLYFSGNMPDTDFAARLNDTLAEIMTAKDEYNSALAEIAAN